MPLPWIIHPTLATVLLCLSVARLILSYWTYQSNLLYHRLNIIASTLATTLLLILVGVSWSRVGGDGFAAGF
jgi:hypothetical protein